MNDLDAIKGIGPKTKNYLGKLGIFNLCDLISHYPFRYEVLKRSNLLTLKQDDKVIIDGSIDSIPSLFRFKANMNKMSFRLRTKEAVVNVIIFNRGFLKNNLQLNRHITVIGKWDLMKNTIVASDIRFETITEEGKIEPIYHITSGLNRKNLINYIDEAMKLYPSIPNYIPDNILGKYHFMKKEQAVRIIHHPLDVNSLKKAMIGLKYEELFLFMLKINILKQKNKEVVLGHPKVVDRKKIEEFIRKLPFSLTVDQVKAVDDIASDIESIKCMNRLLQGDVGSGKTVVAAIAIYIMFLNHFQSAFMVPTEILARQHFENLSKLFSGLNMNIKLLVGDLTKKEKLEIYKGLENGDIDLIIGTHTLIQESVAYHNLGLVITDEQHRFGVDQRGNLKNKGEKPDVLYMSATPIPRTYALTIYGDMDISNIRTMPSNRKNIITYLKSPNDIKEILSMINKELSLDHQIYVVAPLIEDSEDSNLENIEKLERQFEMAFGKVYKIGILHGKMSSKDKENIMKKFSTKDINILISTTVIEVGIDVKDATMMVIFDAQRFGLSTLHQLRGRVGRSDLQSYCILISDMERDRLKIMTETNDGFAISEEDFKLRGQGDLFGVKQSGDMTFKIADLKKDFKILIQARDDAEEFLSHDSVDNYPRIKELVEGSINLD